MSTKAGQLVPPSAPRERLHRGRTLAERRQERREALFEAALELFGTKGYANTSIEELCRVSYVASRYFYEEFGSREALLVALYDRYFDELIASVIAVQVDGGDDHIQEATRARMSVFVHGVLDDPRIARIGLLENGDSTMLEEHRRRAHGVLANFVAGLTVKYVESGDLTASRNWDMIALGMIGAINELLVDWILKDETDRTPIEIFIDDLVEMFMLIRASL